MRLFVRTAGWGRGYYWTEVTADGPRDAGQVPVEHYFDLQRNQDSLAPSLSLYHSAAGYHVLGLGLATRRNEPSRRVITNSLLFESVEERTARLFAAAVLAADAGPVFHPDFEQALDGAIEHDATREHYCIDTDAVRQLVDRAVAAAGAAGEPDPFPDDVFVERLFARNIPERRRELHAALCRYELPARPVEPKPRLLLAVAGLEDAEQLCHAGAWVALSARCPTETWAVFTPPGQPERAQAWDRC